MIVPLDTTTAVILAARLRERDVREVVSTAWNDDPASWAAAMAARPGERFALLDAAGVPVAMGGVTPLWPHVAQSWLVGSEQLPRHALELLRAVKDVHAALAAGGVRRFQTYCLVGFETGRRFLENLQYEFEGRCDGMGKNGEDFDLMARIERRAA